MFFLSANYCFREYGSRKKYLRDIDKKKRRLLLSILRGIWRDPYEKISSAYAKRRRLLNLFVFILLSNRQIFGVSRINSKRYVYDMFIMLLIMYFFYFFIRLFIVFSFVSLKIVNFSELQLNIIFPYQNIILSGREKIYPSNSNEPNSCDNVNPLLE